MVSVNKKVPVVRHNALIESRHSLGLTERRFMLWIVSQIRQDDKELKEYKISVQQWADFLGLKNNPKLYKVIKKTARKLTQKSVGIYYNDHPTRPSFDYYPWFHSISYISGEGAISCKLHPDLMPYLLDLKQYTSITLEYALLFKSAYAGRVYDLLKQYEKIGERKISIQEFREMLELEDSYKLNADLRKNVLDVSQKEINAKSDIKFKYELKKTGRKFTDIVFTITPNKPTVSLENNREESDAKSLRLFQELKNVGVSESKARELINSQIYTQEKLRDCLTVFRNENKELKKANKSEKGVGWLIESIQQGWLFSPELMVDKEAEAEKAEKVAQKRRQRLEVMRQAESEAKPILIAHYEWQNKVITGKSMMLEDVEKEGVISAFFEFIEQGDFSHLAYTTKSDQEMAQSAKFKENLTPDSLEGCLKTNQTFKNFFAHYFPETRKNILEFSQSKTEDSNILEYIEKCEIGQKKKPSAMADWEEWT